jgi:hypothetical protein
MRIRWRIHAIDRRRLADVTPIGEGYIVSCDGGAPGMKVTEFTGSSFGSYFDAEDQAYVLGAREGPSSDHYHDSWSVEV